MSLLVKVGSFVKTVAAAIASQPVTGVGFVPKAVILFQGCNTANVTWQGGGLGSCISFFSSVSDAVAASEATQNAGSLTGSSMAVKAHRCVNTVGTVSNECSLTSFDADGFTLSWTTNDANAQIINYIALGGTELLAKAHTWSMPTTAINKAVSGVGFRPDLVLFLFAQEGQTALPYGTTPARFRLGAMDRAGRQWAFSLSSEHAVTPSDSERRQLSDSCVLANDTNNARLKASYVSMDADGYTVNFSAAPAAAGIVGALALGNINARVGVFAKATGAGPASQGVTGVGFLPLGLILSGVQNTSSAAINVHMEYGLGAASSPTARGAVARIDRDNANPAVSRRYTDTAKAYIKADNATPAVDAAADLTSFDADGFTLSWNPNDAVATELAFIAIGDATVLKGMGRVTQRRHTANRSRMPRGAWRRRSA